MSASDNKSRISSCRLIELDRHHHDNGNLSVVDGGITLPFEIKRTYYTYDIPGGAERGGHSHKECREFIVAISGSFDVEIDDGVERATYTLNRPYFGLLIEPGIWRELKNFSSGSVCMVIASLHYDEQDYVRDYEKFRALSR